MLSCERRGRTRGLEEVREGKAGQREVNLAEETGMSLKLDFSSEWRDFIVALRYTMSLTVMVIRDPTVVTAFELRGGC